MIKIKNFIKQNEYFVGSDRYIKIINKSIKNKRYKQNSEFAKNVKEAIVLTQVHKNKLYFYHLHGKYLLAKEFMYVAPMFAIPCLCDESYIMLYACIRGLYLIWGEKNAMYHHFAMKELTLTNKVNQTLDEVN